MKNSTNTTDILTSCLKEKNLLTSDTKVTFHRTQQKDLLSYFTTEENLVY